MLFFSYLFLPPPHTPCFFPSIFCFWPHAHLTHTNKIFQKVPLSTLAHWQRELARAPSVVCLTLHGTAAARRAIFTWGWEKRAPAASPTPPPTKKREKRAVSYQWNVLLTTYETLAAEHAKLAAVQWSQVCGLGVLFALFSFPTPTPPVRALMSISRW